MTKVSRMGAAAIGALLLPPAAQAEPVPLCATGYTVPRIVPADLVAASDIAIVDVIEVAVPGELECRVKAIVREVERGTLYSAGQKLDFRLNCAGEGTTLRYQNSPWLYSDLPAAGTSGRLYQDHRLAPPGPHFLNLRPGEESVALAPAPAADGRSRSLC